MTPAPSIGLLCAALVVSDCVHPPSQSPEAKMFAKNTDYEQLMGRWSRRLAPLHARFAKVKDGDRVLDVGAGTGVLSLWLEGALPRSEILGIDPSPVFVEYARAHAKTPRLRFEVGDAQALAQEDASVDAALAQLVLNFVPDHARAVKEMRRVTRPGGVVSACVWGYDEGTQMLPYFWDEIVALDPTLAAKKEPTMKLSRQGELAALWAQAGLMNVEEAPLQLELDFTSFDDYWRPFLSGVGPAGAYVASLGEPERQRVAARLRARLFNGRNDGPFTLSARAWCARGVVP